MKLTASTLVGLVGAILALSLLSSRAAAGDLDVLPAETADGPSREQFSRAIKRLAYEALDRRLERYETINTPEQVAAYQTDMRKRFVEALGGFPDRTLLNAKTVGTLKGDGYRVEKVIYESQPRHHVTAVLFLPDSKPPFPGVVVPCGHSRSGKVAQQRMCILLAKNGIAALSYDPIGQGERSQLLDSNGKQRFKATSEHNLVGMGSTLLGRNTATFRIW